MDANKTPKTVEIPSMVRVKDLASVLNLPVARVMQELIKNNIYATINEELDYETATIIAEDLGYQAAPQSKAEENLKESAGAKVSHKETLKLELRPPVVAVMGHVDHGKTTLLDYIRKTNVAGGEAGGITQSIGAYQIQYKKHRITFIDTPGHEAFQSMRARGARLTDLAILVVAADDGVKPQTKEAITHIRSAKIPMIVVINKMDKQDARVDKVKQELAQEGAQIEEWGGNVPLVEISAKTGQGVEELLETIIVVAEMEELKAPLSGPALGTIIESHLSPRQGPEASVLVQSGTFKIGDIITAASAQGKIKRMEDYRGQIIQKAGPSEPVKIVGFKEVPEVGSIVQNGEESLNNREKFTPQEKKILTLINQKASNPKIKKLNLVIKAGSQGSKEAILENLARVQSSEVAPYIIQEGVGNITESDVLKSHITNAKLIGFEVKTTTVAKKLARQLELKINIYEIIYELIDAVKEGLEEILEPEEEIMELGKLEILAIFHTEKGKMIVGGKVTQGTIQRESRIRVQRKGQIIGEGTIVELQSSKQKVKEVKNGQECGIKFLGDVKIEIGDILEFYKIEKKKKTL
ncbi:MAG: translation initiation factor IF-2 [Parcubacteria group bacterium LiPW_72]|nr:MAG: translation initiation factor IF-2 [Parcubacteria group bacterium LiPW_72]